MQGQREPTDQEIDEAIREGRRGREIRATLNVSRERLGKRWEWFRDEVRKRVEAGKSSAEIVQELGLPLRRVAAFRAHLPGRDDDEEIEDAVGTSIGLERDLQNTLGTNIAQLEAGLKIVGKQHRCAAGFIDLLCQDDQGALVVVELKAGEANDRALGQVLGYMGAIKSENAGRPVRGIMVANEFSDRVRHASLVTPNLRLVSYAVQFTFKDQGPAQAPERGAAA
jgi:hypothetical protein